MSQRIKPRFSIQAKILNAQNYRCAYCTHPFGSVVLHKGRRIVTVLEWDHFVPYSYIQRNPDDNWLAACRVCNRLKSTDLFQSREEAAYSIMCRWEEKKYEILWVPETSSEENPDEWTTEYQKYAESIQKVFKPFKEEPIKVKVEYAPEPPQYVDLGRSSWGAVPIMRK